MSYVNRNLLEGEKVVYRAHLHMIIFLLPVTVTVLGLGLVGYLAYAEVIQPSVAWIAAAFVAAVGVVLAFPRLVRYLTSEYAVTNKRVIIKVGVVYRETLELVLPKLETIGVDQSISGRLFNYGTITVTGTGGTKEPFKDIAAPLEFRNHVQSQLT